MPEVSVEQKRKQSIKFRLELAVLFILLLAIGWFSWQLTSEENQQEILAFSHQLIPIIPNPNPSDSTSASPSTTTTSNLFPVSPPPTPRSIEPLPNGRQTYNFSHGPEVVGPKPQKMIIDPLTPEKGQTQSIVLMAKYENPINSIAIEVITDNSRQTHNLSLVAGDNKEGTWQGSWQVNDSYNQKYGLHLVLKSSQDYNNTMWFRN